MAKCRIIRGIVAEFHLHAWLPNRKRNRWENGGNKDGWNENRQSLFRACYSKEVSHHHLNFGRDIKAGNEMRKLYIGWKRRFQVCSDWRVLKRISYRCQNVQGCIFGFPWLVLNWKWGQKIREASSDSSSPHPFWVEYRRRAIWPPTSLIYDRLASWAADDGLVYWADACRLWVRVLFCFVLF